MWRTLLLMCLSCILERSAYAQRTVTDSPQIRVPHPETANPEEDCMRATVRRGNGFI